MLPCDHGQPCLASRQDHKAGGPGSTPKETGWRAWTMLPMSRGGDQMQLSLDLSFLACSPCHQGRRWRFRLPRETGARTGPSLASGPFLYSFLPIRPPGCRDLTQSCPVPPDPQHRADPSMAAEGPHLMALVVCHQIICFMAGPGPSPKGAASWGWGLQSLLRSPTTHFLPTSSSALFHKVVD